MKTVSPEFVRQIGDEISAFIVQARRPWPLRVGRALLVTLRAAVSVTVGAVALALAIAAAVAFCPAVILGLVCVFLWPRR